MRHALTSFVIFLCACGSSSSTNPITTDEDEKIDHCESTSECDAGFTCCGSRCEDVSVSVRSCGACGVECSADEYCTGTACAPSTFRTLCAATDFRTVHRDAKQIDNQDDDPSIDNSAADSLAQAFQSFCGPSAPKSVTTAEADCVAKGGPLSTKRGTTLVVAGGRVYSEVIDYLDNEDVTPVELVVTGDDTFQLVARSQRKVVVAESLQTLDANHDYIVGQAVYDAATGTWILSVYGIFQAGTAAAAAYFNERLSETSFGTTHWFVARYTNGVFETLAGD